MAGDAKGWNGGEGRALSIKRRASDTERVEKKIHRPEVVGT